MKKKRRSRQYKDNSKVIDMDEARRKRHEKHRRSHAKSVNEDKDQKVETARQGKRRQDLRNKQIRRRLLVILAALIVAVLVGASVINLIKLKAEQSDLLKQQEELQEELDQLKEYNKNKDDKEIIEEQARKKMKMLEKGETMYAPEDSEDDD